MELLICETADPSIRAEVFSWDYEDLKDPAHDEFTFPKNILGLLRQGWKLLAPPQGTSEGIYVWWLTKESVENNEN